MSTSSSEIRDGVAALLAPYLHALEANVDSGDPAFDDALSTRGVAEVLADRVLSLLREREAVP